MKIISQQNRPILYYVIFYDSIVFYCVIVNIGLILSAFVCEISKIKNLKTYIKRILCMCAYQNAKMEHCQHQVLMWL